MEDQARQARLEALNKMEHAGFGIRANALIIDSFAVAGIFLLIGLASIFLLKVIGVSDGQARKIFDVFFYVVYCGCYLLYNAYSSSSLPEAPLESDSNFPG